MIQTPLIWSFQQRQMAAFSTQKDVLSDIVGLAYLDIFLSQVPTPSETWSAPLWTSIQIFREKLIAQISHAFSDADTQADLVDLITTKRSVQTHVRAIFRDAYVDASTLDLLNWVMACQGKMDLAGTQRLPSDYATTPIFLITPVLDIVASSRQATPTVIETPNNAFLRWLWLTMIPFTTEIPVGGLDTYLREIVCNIRLPVNPFLITSEKTPYPFTTYVIDGAFRRTFVRWKTAYTYTTVIDALLESAEEGSDNTRHIAGVAWFDVYIEMITDRLEKDGRLKSDSLFARDGLFSESSFDCNKLYDETDSNGPVMPDDYGIGLEAADDTATPQETSVDQTTDATTTADSTDGTDPSSDTSTSDGDGDGDPEDPPEDPSTDDVSEDPTEPDSTEPAGSPTLENDNMDLISFDRSDESVNDLLYRDAVLALSVRISNDMTFPVSGQVRDLLKSFTEFYIYRVGIQSVKDFVEAIGLQDYLSPVSTNKG